MNPVLKKIKGQPTNQGSDEQRTRTWVMSTFDVDRDGERVRPEGIKFENYARTGRPVMWNHDTDQKPIGNLTEDPWLDYVGEGTAYEEVTGPKRLALLGRVKFSKSNPDADRIWGQVQEGSIRGGSVSFVPTGRANKDADGHTVYDESDLIEFTICSIGSNMSAVSTHKKCHNCKAKTCTGSCKSIRTKVSGPVKQLPDGPDGAGWYVLDNGKPVWGPFDSKENAEHELREQYSSKSTGTRIKLMPKNKGPLSDADRASMKEYLNGLSRMSTQALKDEFKRSHRVSDTTGVPKADMVAQLFEDHYGRRRVEEYFSKSLRSQKMLHRKCWIKSKSAWLLKSDGGLDEETKDYLMERGLDEVRIEDQPPVEEGWEEEEMMEPEHVGMPSQDRSKVTTGAMPPEGKAEEIADDVAVRADALAKQGVEEEPAIEAAMEEEGVPKSMRPAVKALVKSRKNVRKADGDKLTCQKCGATYTEAQSKQVDGSCPNCGNPYPQGMNRPKSILPGSICRNTKTGQLCLVKSCSGKQCKVVKVNGDEEDVDAKKLKVKLKSNEWGLPTKITGQSGDLQAKLTNWYGTLTGMLKHLAPTLKDADLTGEEQGTVEGAVDEAFMKVAKDMDVKPSNLNDVGTTKAVGEDSLVPQAGLSNRTDDKDDSISPQSTQKPDWTGASDSVVPAKSVNKDIDLNDLAENYRNLPNGGPRLTVGSGGQVGDGHHLIGNFGSPAAAESALRSAGFAQSAGGWKLQKSKRLRVPKALFKTYVQKVAEEIADKHAGKLKSTICKRAVKFVMKATDPEDMDDKACMQALAKSDDDLTDTEKGLLAAKVASSKSKWQKKYGACGKTECSKNLLCGKCVKKLVKALPGDLENLAETVPDTVVMGDERGNVVDLQNEEIQPWGLKAKELQGTDEPSPSANLSTAMDAPGNIPTKSKDEDGDDDVEKRAQKLLRSVSKGDGDDLDDEDLKTLAKRLEKIANGQDAIARTIYQRTAIKAY